MKKSFFLLAFTHIVAVFIGMYLFYIVNITSESNIRAWYNGTIDLSVYNKAPKIMMMNKEKAIYLYPADYIDNEGYLTEEGYEKIQYENLGVYLNKQDAQKAYIRLNEYFQKNLP